METIRYTLTRGNTLGIHPLVHDFESKVIRGEAAAYAARQLKKEGYFPDVIYGHPGWGETLFLKDIWPNAKLLAYCEFYYNFRGADSNFDPEFPEDEQAAARLTTKNPVHLLASEAMDLGISPTQWQRAQYPQWAQNKISVIHDGIDTDSLIPNPKASIRSSQNGLAFNAEDEIITYVNRNLEPCRGFHVFMRSLPDILRRRPMAQVLIIGGEDAGYGQKAPGGSTWKQFILNEVGGELDPSRVHFLGKVPYQLYQTVLQLSTVHVYLTYPFVLSWSMLEAMSTGCLLVGSATPPVQEVITHGKNGLLVDFFDVKGLANTICEALIHRHDYTSLRAAARTTAIGRFDLKQVCLPQQLKLVERLL